MNNEFLAQLIRNPSIRNSVGNLTSGDSPTIVQSFITSFIRMGISIAGLVFFFMLLRGAYEYLTAGGDKDAVQRSTKRFTTAFIGIAILLSIFALVTIVDLLFGIDLRQLVLPQF